MKNLIIFADYGLDDAAATASIFNNREKFGRITVVPIGGNVPVEMSFQNCLTLLNTLKQTSVAVVDTRNIKQPGEYLADIHGLDGMGDIFEKSDVLNGIELEGFEEFTTKMSGDETILSLGPTILVAEVLKRYPNCELVLMGGCIEEAPNFNGYEFNHALDTESFSFCTEHRHVAVTLDTCIRGGLSIKDIDIDGNDVYSQILRASQKLSMRRGESGCYVWDDVAACYLLHPERFALKQRADRWGNLLTEAVYIDAGKYFE